MRHEARRLPCSPEWGEPVEAGDLELLRTAVLDGNAKVVNKLLTEHANQITLNTSRAAIQVKNGTGIVFVHMPVSSELLGSLTAACH